MKKMKLALILLICAFLAFGAFACADDTTDGGGTDYDPQPNNGDVIAPPEEEMPYVAKLLPNIPSDLDFGEYDFRIFFRSEEENIVLFSGDIHAEELTGEAINDAVFMRNRYLEEKFNFTITGIPSSSGGIGWADAGTVRRFVQAGDDVFDVVVTRMSEVANLMTTNTIVDFNEIPYIDLTQPWWNQALAEQISIGPHVFGVAGDLIATHSNALRVIFHNKHMVEELALDCPYELVRTGQWTLEKFYSMIQDVSQDLTGDGIMGINDQYGFLIQGGSTIKMFYATGHDFTTRDENNIPIPLLPDVRAMSVLNMLNQILTTTDAIMFDFNFVGIDPRGSEYVLMTTFADNRGLFFGEILQLAERMRAYDIYFGILPPPKADEHQENYMAWADGWCLNMIVVPITNTDLVRTGQILEAMAAESRYTVRPAYYYIALTSQFARDEESSEMLDIIIANPVISLDEAFNWGMHGAISGDLRYGRDSFASSIERVERNQERQMERAIERIMGW